MASAPNAAEAAKTPIGRLFSGLAVLGAVAALGLWIWFAISDGSRVWNRIASTFGADRPSSAGPWASRPVRVPDGSG